MKLGIESFHDLESLPLMSLPFRQVCGHYRKECPWSEVPGGFASGDESFSEGSVRKIRFLRFSRNLVCFTP